MLILFTLLPLPPALAQPAAPQDDYSGMYSFLKDGEFVQITIEDQGAVSGFISRFGDSESDKGSFLDQFFKSGTIEGSKLSFATENVHGAWFRFAGSFERGPGKKPEDEAYYLLRGTLTRFNLNGEHQTATQTRTVEFRSFPRDATPTH
ncbi:MAG: hypothetical protein JO159_16965 [Acidobacteria bacterium]|nr:hypothetical protein [Acidobacteriota bacterium]